ncbi:hypothetical protein [Sphingobacterium bambusae]|uniref:Transposase DDE domain-containing protein n=1 Tax=Sphingobacterium bambusae TaxID=662858 RepID=A0ABW6BJQ0_9SPHI|nr:hypothetical protein [Sphingobacterium bambusae]WPL50574.1 hypothetical protein SCB77_08945 [Sphingobacterium bambusae]
MLRKQILLFSDTEKTPAEENRTSYNRKKTGEEEFLKPIKGKYSLADKRMLRSIRSLGNAKKCIADSLKAVLLIGSSAYWVILNACFQLVRKQKRLSKKQLPFVIARRRNDCEAILENKMQIGFLRSCLPRSSYFLSMTHVLINYLFGQEPRLKLSVSSRTTLPSASWRTISR